jgi:Fur family ferric uptake transcriptional regulator
MDAYAKRVKLEAVLKSHKLKLTRQRRAVFDALTRYAPISNARLGDELADTLDRATVYRTLELFESIEVVQRVWSGWKSQVELSESFVPHHHHATCRICGRHLEVNSVKLEAELYQLAEEMRFRLEDHSVELTGVCASCAGSTP